MLRTCLKTLPPDSQRFDNLILLQIKYISRYALDLKYSQHAKSFLNKLLQLNYEF